MRLFDPDEHDAQGIPDRKPPWKACACRDRETLAHTTRNMATGQVKCNRCGGVRQAKREEKFVPDYRRKIRRKTTKEERH